MKFCYRNDKNAADHRDGTNLPIVIELVTDQLIAARSIVIILVVVEVATRQTLGHSRS